MAAELLEGNHTRAELRTIERAIRNPEWHIPDVLYQQLAVKLGQIVATGKPREVTAAARCLIAMDESNKRNGPRKVEHSHSIQFGPVNSGNIEERKRQLALIIAGGGDHSGGGGSGPSVVDRADSEEDD